MKGEILIEDLAVNCIIGILSYERATPQTLLLNISMEIDFSVVGGSDRVADTVNYAEIAEQISALAVERQFQLVEAMVATACQQILANYPTVNRVEVTARKPDIMPGSTVVGARLALSRD